MDSVQEARREGFRPCKRCKPDEVVGLADWQAAIIGEICKIIESTEERLTLDHLAAIAEMSRFHFHRLFRQVTGVIPKAYENAHRSN